MARATASHATEMRRRILEGAHRAMLEGGYRGTTMPEIAAAAGVSVGLLYRYFTSKEQLYLAMCEAVTQAQLDELAVELSRISDPRERLASAVGLFVDSLEAERWGAIITTGWAEADVNPELRDLLRRRCDQIRAFAAMFLREGVARGEVDPDADVEELSLAVTMLMDGVVAHQAEQGDRFDPALVRRSVNALLDPLIRR
ncbi:MAG TPA: TetR/AcrR family transcriptional regulator [Candidatus Limnocylindria bacterium]|nr:TetR/AcrR family transcriptional regulator [Candidatus Limnocylindria bacterium]